MTISICINSKCIASNQQMESAGRFCQHCGSDLIFLNRYRAISTIRVDRGFSNVYEVEDRSNTKVLKVLNQVHSKNSRTIQLFRQEVDILSHLDHPGIPKCDCYFQFELSNGERLNCIVMEKLNGCNLEDWVHKNKPICEKTALEWLEQITKILKFVHDEKYLHRDIKPHNIMLNEDSQLVLIDFGAATRINLLYKAYAITISSVRFFVKKDNITDGYTAPEQNKSYCTPQSDIFALGKSFIFLLTGMSPRDKTMYNDQTGKTNWRKYTQGISEEFANIIDRAIEYDLKKRYKNTQELLDDIGRLRKASGSLI